jgi:hypothetical protein
MNEPVDQAALTQAGPTQSAPQESATWAYSDVTDVIDYSPASNVRVGLIVGGILAAAAAMVTALLLVNRAHHEAAPTASAATAAPIPAGRPPLPPPAAVIPPTPSRPPAPVSLPTHGGIVYVGTQSGKIACEVTPGTVACNVKFTVRTPIRYGTPANVVTISAVGAFDWGIGDTGEQQYRTLSYGTVYHAFGWTITPTSDGTTFMNDATAHGMTVNTEGALPF